MELSKRRYTYGKSYGGYLYWRYDNKTNTNIVLKLTNQYDEEFGIETNYTCHENTYKYVDALPISKQEFIDRLKYMLSNIKKIDKQIK